MKAKLTLLLLGLLPALALGTIINVPADYATIQAAIDAAAPTGDEIIVADDNYTISTTLNVNKSVTIDGISESGVILDASTCAGYGMLVTADDVVLRDMTMVPPAVNYPIHASGTGNPPGGYDGLTIDHMTIEGVHQRTAFDIHGYSNVLLSYLTAGDATGGNGIQVTGCLTVTMDHITTHDNAWGSIAIYCSSSSHLNRGSDDVTINGDSCVLGEVNIYSQHEFGLFNTDVSVTGYEYLVKNDTAAPGYDLFQDTLGDASAVALAMGSASYIIEIATGDLVVTAGMSIQAAVYAAAPGDEIDVAAGTYYEDSIDIDKSLTITGITGTCGPDAGAPVIDGSGADANCFEIAPGVDDVTIEGFFIRNFGTSPADAGEGCGIWAYGTSSDPTTNITVRNNQFDACTWCSVFFFNEGQSLFDNIQVHCNTVNIGSWSSNTNVYGIEITNCKNSTVSNNTVTDGFTGVVMTAQAHVGPVVVENNTITNNSVSGSVGYGGNITAVAWGDYGATIQNTTITHNDIVVNHTDVGFGGFGIRSYPSTGGSFAGNFDVNNNSIITDPGYSALRNQTGVVWDASGNYYGSTDATTVAAAVGADIDYSPWLGGGTINTPGFQGDFSELWVGADSPITGSDGIIQEGINLVDGSTVNVAAGTYEEQLHVTTNDLSVIGAGVSSTTILSPAALTEYYTTSLDNYPIVFVDGCTGFSLSHLTLDGAGRGNSNYRFQGIGFWNSGGTVSHVSVLNVSDTPFSGAQHGVGIYAYNDDDGPHTVVLNDVLVDDYQKGGVALSGDGLTVDLDQVVTHGAGATTVTAQNGIQISYGAGGTVTDCDVDGNIYTGGGWASSGMLLYMATTVDIDGDCQIMDNCPGIYAQEVSGSLTGGTISNQDPDSWDGLYVITSGATLVREDGHSLAPASPMVENYTPPGSRVDRSFDIDNSSITGHDLEWSWGVYFKSTGDVLTVNMTDCLVTDWDIGIYVKEDGGTVNSTINGCGIFSNDSYVDSYGLFVEEVVIADATTQDATNNWWGDATGPYNDPDNLAGLGNPVSPWVDFDPYRTGNVVFTPDPQTISLADLDGGVYKDGVVCDYLGGGSDALYGYSIEVTWDSGVITANTGDFTRPLNGSFASAVMFQVTTVTNGVRIDAALGGATPGILSGELFKATYTAAATPDYATSDLTFNLRYFRDNANQPLSGFYGDDGLYIVDLIGPAISDVTITNTTMDPDTEDCVKHGDDITVTANIADGGGMVLADITADLEDFDGGSAVIPDSYLLGVATWALTGVTCIPADGTITVTVYADDGAGNSSSSSDTITADNTAPDAVTDLDATPQHHVINLSWTDVADNTGYYLHRAKRDNYPYFGWPVNAGESSWDSDYVQIDVLGADDDSYSDDFLTDAEGTRAVYDYKLIAFDCPDNRSAVSNTGSATNYFLGDIVGYNGEIIANDLAVFSTNYGTGSIEGSTDHIDFGPTSDWSNYGLPEPDGLIDFEDLIIFAMNYGVGGPTIPITGFDQQRDKSAPATDVEMIVTLTDAEDGYQLVLTGELKGFSARLQTERQLVSASAAGYTVMTYRNDDAWVIDIIALEGLIPDGTAIALDFNGEGNLELTSVDGRDGWNQPVILSFENSLTENLPTVFSLAQNYPNPFNPVTTINYDLAATVPVRLLVYNSLGQQVATLVHDTQPAGRYSVSFDGSSLASGLYFYAIQAGEFNDLQKMMLVK